MRGEWVMAAAVLGMLLVAGNVCPSDAIKKKQSRKKLEKLEYNMRVALKAEIEKAIASIQGGQYGPGKIVVEQKNQNLFKGYKSKVVIEVKKGSHVKVLKAHEVKEAAQHIFQTICEEFGGTLPSSSSKSTATRTPKFTPVPNFPPIMQPKERDSVLLSYEVFA